MVDCYSIRQVREWLVRGRGPGDGLGQVRAGVFG